MNTELEKVAVWLRTKGESVKSYRDLSKDRKGNPLVTDTTAEAYGYDSIIRSFFAPGVHPCCCSCDALLLKEHLYLIEFKSPGRDIDFFDCYLANISNTKKRQAWHIICSVESKLGESLYMLKKCILQPLDVDEKKFEKYAVIVYNSNNHAAQGRSASMASASGQQQTSLMHKRFMGRDVGGNPVFFHAVKTVPNSLFPSLVLGLN